MAVTAHLKRNQLRVFVVAWQCTRDIFYRDVVEKNPTFLGIKHQRFAHSFFNHLPSFRASIRHCIIVLIVLCILGYFSRNEQNSYAALRTIQTSNASSSTLALRCLYFSQLNSNNECLK